MTAVRRTLWDGEATLDVDEAAEDVENGLGELLMGARRQRCNIA